MYTTLANVPCCLKLFWLGLGLTASDNCYRVVKTQEKNSEESGFFFYISAPTGTDVY